MISNFEFLKNEFPYLYSLGRKAEELCDSAPRECLYNLVAIGAAIVNLIVAYDKVKVDSDNIPTLVDILYREGYLYKDIADILRLLNKKKQEGDSATSQECHAALSVILNLCEWFAQVYGTGTYGFTEYSDDISSNKTDDAPYTFDEKHLYSQELKKAKTSIAISKIDRQTKAGKVSEKRPVTEAETRMLIDDQLRKVGWKVNTFSLRYSQGYRPVKGDNMAISEWPTDSAVTKGGFADYALFIGEKMVGIMEAKSFHKDIPSVIDYQCKDYASHIRSVDHPYLISRWGNYSVPFVFATNGRSYNEKLKIISGIWYLDLRNPANVPKALRGWMSPTGINDLLKYDAEKASNTLRSMDDSFLSEKSGLNLRTYQIDAVHAAEEAIENGQNNVLLAMATGTGKTRTVLGLIYSFLKSRKFNRILFLVDRNALGEQAHEVFKNVRLEQLKTLEDMYNIKALADKEIEADTSVQVATVQSMVKRIIYNNDNTMPAVTDYDLVIIDEAHRGYTLDKEMGDDEILYRDQNDYQSKYKQVLEYFDAVKIALTATPALHTTEIFGTPVYTYSYRDAVLDGYLVDYNAPHIIKTKLSTEGINYNSGDVVDILDLDTKTIEPACLPDELNFEVDQFNKQVITEDFNRTVLNEIAWDFDPDNKNKGKTLIYAVNDQHADLIVSILKEIYAEGGVSNEAVMKITGSVAGGNQKKIQEAIRRFKNEQYPSVVVTVDLLTTGIDVPSITSLVFLRRVKSRILFEQMIGRATRLCPEIRKDHFEIYDAVGVFDAIEDVSTMKPVSVNPTVTFSDLVKGLTRMEEEDQIEAQIDQIIAKLQRKVKNISYEVRDEIAEIAGMSVDDFIKTIGNLDSVSAKEFIIDNSEAFSLLDNYKEERRRVVVISDKDDEVLSNESGYGPSSKPEDYLESFSTFLKEHYNDIAALNIICTRPKDLTSSELKDLRKILDNKGFTENFLNDAVSRVSNKKIVADMITLVRRYTIGSKLISHDDRIKNAVERLRKAHNFNGAQLQWLKRIEDYLLNSTLLNVQVFDDDDRFKSNGGFKRINNIFGNNLNDIVRELNSYLYDDGGSVA